MALLLENDYRELESQGFTYVEDEAQRFLVLYSYPLPKGLYNVEACDVIVIIPENYNQGGNDMFWTHPHLSRLDGKGIPNACAVGGGDNRTFENREFCRWSRHWSEGSSVWKAGVDDISTILRRVTWALNNPDTK